MKKSILSVLVLTAIAAHAGPQEKTFYAGFKSGINTFHDGVNQFKEREGKPLKALTVDKHSAVYGVFLGYQFPKNLAAELEFANLGKLKATSATKNFKHRANNLALSLKYSYPVLDNVDVYARFGSVLVNSRYNVDNRASSPRSLQKTTRNFSWVLAGGVEYSLTNSLGLRLEYQHTNNVGDTNVAFKTDVAPFYRPDSSVFSLGLVYRFGQKLAMQPHDEPVMHHDHEGHEYNFSTDVFFGSNSAVVTQDSKALLKNVYDNLKNSNVSELQVEVNGFADRTGPAAYNLKLSQKRAEAVAQYLLSQGLNKDSLKQVKGFGSANSITGDACDEVKQKSDLVTCLSPDRRVELTITGHKHAE